MVFQFEHVELDSSKNYKWNDVPPKLSELKKTLNKWQIGLEGVAWNSLFWNNHDQPRVVSRFGNDSKEYREISAKMLGTCLHMMKGTPYVYQGEELGMTNIKFSSIEEFNDIESINAYKELVVENNVLTPEKMISCLNFKSRDNARTPMQWDSSENAGFTKGTPWIKVNQNYTYINAESQVNDENSIYNYYKKLIKLRHENDIIVYGTYEPLLEDSEEIFAYTRTLGEEKILVICNFTKNEVNFEVPEDIKNLDMKLLISNYDERKFENNLKLKAYEALVFITK